MSQNVWADLGFADHAAMQQKCDISIEIETLMREARISVRAAAQAIGISTAALTAILHGHFEDLSLASLESNLAALQSKVVSAGTIPR